MPTINFHDLPIYRLTEKDYDTELRERAHKIVYYPPVSTSEQSKARACAGLLDHFMRRFGRWRFNEVVGYVRLSITHRRIQGAYFGRRSDDGTPRGAPLTREVRTRTKVFLSVPPLAAPQVIPPGSTNAECLRIIDEYIGACRKAFPRRHFHKQWLSEVGPYVDWCAIADASDQ